MSEQITTIPTNWKSVLLLCGKCARKLEGGFGTDGKQRLAKALQVELRGRGQGRSVRVLETRCIGLCPKKSVTAFNMSNPEVIFSISQGTDTDEVLKRLL